MELRVRRNCSAVPNGMSGFAIWASRIFVFSSSVGIMLCRIFYSKKKQKVKSIARYARTLYRLIYILTVRGWLAWQRFEPSQPDRVIPGLPCCKRNNTLRTFTFWQRSPREEVPRVILRGWQQKTLTAAWQLHLRFSLFKTNVCNHKKHSYGHCHFDLKSAMSASGICVYWITEQPFSVAHQ